MMEHVRKKTMEYVCEGKRKIRKKIKREEKRKTVCT